MKYKVLSRGMMKVYSYQSHPEHSMVISIYTPGDRPIQFREADLRISNIDFIFSVCFNDSELGEEKSYGEPISKKQAHDIVNFVKLHKNQVDQIIVHCDAGVSRSAGVCAAIAKALDNDDSYFFQSAFYCPNMTCYRRVLNAFIEGE